MNTIALLLALSCGDLPQSTLPPLKSTLPQSTLPAAPSVSVTLTPTVKPDMRISISPKRPSVAPVPRVQHAPVAGQHSHRCGKCGNVWSHGADSHGNSAQHMCPRCGAGPWWSIYSRRTVSAGPGAVQPFLLAPEQAGPSPRPAPMLRFALVNDCPPGQV